MSAVIESNGDVYFTGNLQPSVKTCSAPRYQPKMSKTDLIQAIEDPERSRAEIDIFDSDLLIKDQGQRSSCNGYAAKGACERARLLAGMPHVELSGEHLYSKINGGIDEGSHLKAGMEELVGGGIAPFQKSHYQKYLPSDFKPEDHRDAIDFRPLECYGIDSESELAEALVLGFIAVLAVHATNNYMRMNSKEVAASSLGPGNHAEGGHDVRIRDGELEFRKFGSWGKRVWNKGCCWITWKDHLVQSNKYHFFYAIRAVRHGGQDGIPA